MALHTSIVRTASLLACALGIWACGATPESLDMAPAPDLAVAPDLATTPDLGYPAGPYGVDVGSVLADWEGDGYRLTPASMDVTVTPWQRIALSSFRSCRCLYIDLTANCTPPCKQEYVAVNRYMAGTPAAGFCPLEVTLDDYGTGAPATKTFLDGYLTRNPHGFPVVILDANSKSKLPIPANIDPAARTLLGTSA